MLSEMENLFLALADKTRLRLINLMRENEISVGDFAEILGESQPKVSRHLAYLRSAGIVSTRRDGKLIYYSLLMPENSFVANVIKDTFDWLNSQEKLREDYARLISISATATELRELSESPALQIYAQSNTIRSDREELAVFLL